MGAVVSGGAVVVVGAVSGGGGGATGVRRIVVVVLAGWSAVVVVAGRVVVVVVTGTVVVGGGSSAAVRMVLRHLPTHLHHRGGCLHLLVPVGGGHGQAEQHQEDQPQGQRPAPPRTAGRREPVAPPGPTAGMAHPGRGLGQEPLPGRHRRGQHRGLGPGGQGCTGQDRPGQLGLHPGAAVAPVHVAARTACATGPSRCRPSGRPPRPGRHTGPARPGPPTARPWNAPGAPSCGAPVGSRGPSSRPGHRPGPGRPGPGPGAAPARCGPARPGRPPRPGGAPRAPRDRHPGPVRHPRPDPGRPTPLRRRPWA